jgi:hypothetical protein
LAASTLAILFSEMLKFSEISFLPKNRKKKENWKENFDFFWKFHLSKLKISKLIISVSKLPNYYDNNSLQVLQKKK